MNNKLKLLGFSIHLVLLKEKLFLQYFQKNQKYTHFNLNCINSKITYIRICNCYS